jgi:hypothetical protein
LVAGDGFGDLLVCENVPAGGDRLALQDHRDGAAMNFESGSEFEYRLTGSVSGDQLGDLRRVEPAQLTRGLGRLGLQSSWIGGKIQKLRESFLRDVSVRVSTQQLHPIRPGAERPILNFVAPHGLSPGGLKWWSQNALAGGAGLVVQL